LGIKVNTETMQAVALVGIIGTLILLFKIGPSKERQGHFTKIALKQGWRFSPKATSEIRKKFQLNNWLGLRTFYNCLLGEDESFEFCLYDLQQSGRLPNEGPVVTLITYKLPYAFPKFTIIPIGKVLLKSSNPKGIAMRTHALFPKEYLVQASKKDEEQVRNLFSEKVMDQLCKGLVLHTVSCDGNQLTFKWFEAEFNGHTDIYHTEIIPYVNKTSKIVKSFF
jgi:hypothetical protein